MHRPGARCTGRRGRPDRSDAPPVPHARLRRLETSRAPAGRSKSLRTCHPSGRPARARRRQEVRRSESKRRRLCRSRSAGRSRPANVTARRNPHHRTARAPRREPARFGRREGRHPRDDAARHGRRLRQRDATRARRAAGRGGRRVRLPGLSREQRRDGRTHRRARRDAAPLFAGVPEAPACLGWVATLPGTTCWRRQCWRRQPLPRSTRSCRTVTAARADSSAPCCQPEVRLSQSPANDQRPAGCCSNR